MHPSRSVLLAASLSSSELTRTFRGDFTLYVVCLVQNRPPDTHCRRAMSHLTLSLKATYVCGTMVPRRRRTNVSKPFDDSFLFFL